MENYDEKVYKKAKKRVEDLKGFYIHLITYIIINFFLFIINLIFTPGIWWFLFPLILWGIGLVFHFLGIFVFENKVLGKEWEEKKIKKYLEEENKK